MSPFLGTRGAGSNRAFGYAGAAAPAQVTGLTATDFGTSRAYNNGRIDLSWSTPANNGATISGYLIERSTDGSSYSTLVANTGSSATTYSDTSLSSAQIYYYKVSAINAAGTGLASTAANATATTVPQAPTIGTASTASGTSASITFTSNATGGKAVSTYTATSSPGSITGTNSVSPITVSGLTTGTAYTFTVTATNANGTSTASSASNSVTPQTFWATSYETATTSNTGYTYASTLDSSNNFYCGGEFPAVSNLTDRSEAIFQKFNNSGSPQLQFYYKGVEPMAEPDILYGLNIDSSNNIYTCGTIYPSASYPKGNLVKFNSAGTIQWQNQIYGSNSTGEVKDIVADSSGNVYATGLYYSGSERAFLLKTNSSGVIQWIRCISSLYPAGHNSGGRKLALDSSGNIYVTGYSRSATPYTIGFVSKYNSSGTVQWQKSITGDWDGYATSHSIAVDSSGNVYIGGQMRNTNTGNDGFLAKLDTNGNLSWQRKIYGDNSANNRQDVVRGIGVDSSGNVYVSGYYYNSGNVNVGFIAKYNSSGTIQWQRQFRSINNYALLLYSCTVASDGTVFATGVTKNNSNVDKPLSIKYPSNGSYTGTYTISSGKNLIIENGILTDTSGTAAYATAALDTTAPTYTYEATNLVKSSFNPTNSLVTF